MNRTRARRLRKLREELGWSYAAVASQIGCDEKVIRQWEAAADDKPRVPYPRDAPDWFMTALEAYADHIRQAPAFPQLHDMNTLPTRREPAM